MDFKNIYFIGIGGIGMSALARYFKFQGLNVQGYDKTSTTLTAELESEGIGVHYEDRPELLPDDIANTLVIYTPAVPDDLGELVQARLRGYRVIKRSLALGEVARGRRCLAVAGTHGKTTTSTLAAHILTESGETCSAFLGGISLNYGTNMLMSRNQTVVAEADEFDRSFLQLHPETAVITAMDADHLDIYGSLESYRQAFRDFASQVGEILIVKYGLPVGKGDTGAKILTYSYDDPRADFHAEHPVLDPSGHISYKLVHPKGSIEEVRVGVPGWVNAENSVAAAAICLCYGIDPQAVKNAIASFKGVKRRLEEHISSPGLSYVDDYAHHPKELASAISSLREMFPCRKLTAIFQPHLYTRTRDFAEGFAQALSTADKVILLDIYPAREKPIPGVSSEMIFSRLSCREKMLLKKEELLDYLEHEPLDVLVSFGAGNIDNYVQPIAQMLGKRL